MIGGLLGLPSVAGGGLGQPEPTSSNSAGTVSSTAQTGVMDWGDHSKGVAPVYIIAGASALVLSGILVWRLL